LNYSAGKGYPAATSAPAGATSQQQEYYGTGASRYTYIFYTKGNAEVTDTGCTLKFVTDTPVANTEVASPVTGFTKGDTFKDFPSAPTVPGYSSSYWCAPDGTKVDEATGYVVKGDSTFKLVYVKDPDVVMHKVTWIDADGSSEVTEVPEGRTATHGAPSKFDPDKKAINESTGGWVQQGTGKTLDQVPIENDSVVFVADLVDKYPVHFKYSDSKTVNGDPVVKGKFATAPEEIPDPPAADKEFEKWVLQGDESKSISNYPITAETTFVPKFKAKATGWSVTYTINDNGKDEWNDIHRYAIKLKFSGPDGAQFSNLTIKIKFKNNAQAMYYSNATITGAGTKTLTIKPMLWGNKFSNGSEFDLQGYVSNFKDKDNVIESITIVAS
jgi:hypothetical protein